MLQYEVKKLEEGCGILIMGSGTIVQNLANEGLIEEYVFFVTPVVADNGKPLFKQVRQFGLTLKETTAFKSGNVIMRYELKK
ncbi:dihydrofolate reductase family protein [Bacillus litorisediminis]|uniref:dihydrofolate reductase family protein n=1 Tax=Bacillus litorisediminis TaxID=2922713 RepID=UPI001FAECBD9|nr:dihydrofolate reductase family protein [Bacillus litorisediminis]